MESLAIILAAGLGTRMESDLPKCLHKIADKPMVDYSILAASEAGIKNIAVIVGYGSELMIEAVEKLHEIIDTQFYFVKQNEQLGTGHAAAQALDLINKTNGVVTVLFGDSPLIKPATIRKLNLEAAKANAPVVLGFQAQDPTGYGRLITKGDKLIAITEQKEATEEELKIKLCNSGVMACPAQLMSELLPNINNNNQKGEYYLTDLVELALRANHQPKFMLCDQQETLGVNTQQQLKEVEKIITNKPEL